VARKRKSDYLSGGVRLAAFLHGETPLLRVWRETVAAVSLITIGAHNKKSLSDEALQGRILSQCLIASGIEKCNALESDVSPRGRWRVRRHFSAKILHSNVP
jgi:hypothetical protein